MKKFSVILIALAGLLLCDTQVFAAHKKPSPIPPPIATIQGRVVDIDVKRIELQ